MIGNIILLRYCIIEHHNVNFNIISLSHFYNHEISFAYIDAISNQFVLTHIRPIYFLKLHVQTIANILPITAKVSC